MSLGLNSGTLMRHFGRGADLHFFYDTMTVIDARRARCKVNFLLVVRASEKQQKRMRHQALHLKLWPRGNSTQAVQGRWNNTYWSKHASCIQHDSYSCIGHESWHPISFPRAEHHMALGPKSKVQYEINVGRNLTFLRPDICYSRSEGFSTTAGVVHGVCHGTLEATLDTPRYAVDKGNTDVMHESDICKMSLTSADTCETREWPKGCRAVKPAIVMSMTIRQAVQWTSRPFFFAWWLNRIVASTASASPTRQAVILLMLILPIIAVQVIRVLSLRLLRSTAICMAEAMWGHESVIVSMPEH